MPPIRLHSDAPLAATVPANEAGRSRQQHSPWMPSIPQGRHGGTGSRRKTSSGAPMRHDAADPDPTPSRLQRGCGSGREVCSKCEHLQHSTTARPAAAGTTNLEQPSALVQRCTASWRQHVHSGKLQARSHAVLCCAPMDHRVKGATSCCPSTSVSCLRTVDRRARPSASASARPAAAAASADSAVSPRRRRDRRVGSWLVGSGCAGRQAGGYRESERPSSLLHNGGSKDAASQVCSPFSQRAAQHLALVQRTSGARRFLSRGARSAPACTCSGGAAAAAVSSRLASTSPISSILRLFSAMRCARASS